MSDDPDFEARGDYWAQVAALANKLWRESGQLENDDTFWLAAMEQIESPPPHPKGEPE